MAARSTFTRTSGSVITSAWANSLRDHLPTITTSNDVSSEGQLAVNTSSDAVVIHDGSGVVELARYGALSAITLSTQQSFGVASNNGGGYGRNGTWIDANVSMYFTTNGATGFAITVDTNLPPPTYQLRAGDFTFIDSGSSVYEGSVLIDTAGILTFYCHDSAGALLGQTPSFAINVGDQLFFSLRYPAI